MAIPGSSIPYPKQIPIFGQNSKDAIDGMDPRFATYIQNWICRNDVLELRKGYSPHCSGLGGSVKSLIPHYDEDGTERLIAAANGNLWNVTTGTASSLASGLTNDEWQYTQLDGATVMVNGADTPKYYTVAAGLTNTAWTKDGAESATFTPSQAIQVINFKGRLYLVMAGKAGFWYGDDGAFASGGNFKYFPVGKLFRRGGHVKFVASYSRDTGDSTRELLVVMSSNGEIIAYAGTSPDSADWDDISKFYVGRPIGRRAYFEMGPDLYIITENGTYALSDLLSLGQANRYSAISNNLMRDWNRAARLYKNNFGWSGFVWDFGQYGLVNVPISSTRSFQYVFNPQSRAWSTFTGINAISWAVLGDKLYFGNSSGVVMEMESGLTDNGEQISCEIRWAYDFLGYPLHEKLIKEVRLYLRASGEVTFDVCINTDYKDSPVCSTNTLSAAGGTAWDTEDWNTFEWAGGIQPYAFDFGAAGQGAAIQVRVKCSVENIQCELASIRVLHDRGGFR